MVVEVPENRAWTQAQLNVAKSPKDDNLIIGIPGTRLQLIFSSEDTRTARGVGAGVTCRTALVHPFAYMLQPHSSKTKTLQTAGQSVS